jgi:hypothetical protein
MNSTLYFRENAPSCFEASLFEDETGLDGLLQSLFSNGLDWYWLSSREYDPAEEFNAWNLPERRRLTLLTGETRPILRQDLLEEDIDLNRRSVTIFGIEPDRKILSAADFREKLKDFLTHENASVKCVINQICDTKPQYIFAANHPGDKMERLLKIWGLDNNSAARRKYRQLHLAKLEEMFEPIVGTAFPESI